ncbi:MAG: hypothetical protein R3B06_32060 [Kofleriaceae bacterium]
MTKLLGVALVALAALAGCPPTASYRYFVAEVRAADQPVAGAMVVVECGRPTRHFVGQTDDTGGANVALWKDVDATTCAAMVAKPGFRTATLAAAAVCDTPMACAAVVFELTALATSAPAAAAAEVTP